MGDLFDDFMKELRRRQDEARTGRSDDSADGEPEAGDVRGEDRPTDRAGGPGSSERNRGESGGDGPPPAGPEPTPLRRPARGTGRSRVPGSGGRVPREPRLVRTADDDNGRPGSGRTVGLAVVGAVILA